MKKILNKKRIVTTTCVFVLAAALLIALFACVSKVTDTVLNRSVSANKIYAFSALTTASMMSEAFAVEPDNAAPIAAEQNRAEPRSARPEAVGGDVEALNNYLKMFEGFLVGNGVNETVTAPTDADGAYADYTYKVTMEAPRLDGEKDFYTLYYSEFEQSSDVKLDFLDDEQDTDDNKDDKPNASKFDRSGKEVEVSTRLAGVMLLQGAVYPVKGAKNVEEEDGETETQIVFTTYQKEGDLDNFIRVEEELEDDEVEYTYTVVRDGTVVSRTKIEVENDAEEREQEVELTFLDVVAGTPSRTKYRFEREIKADGSAEIEIGYSVDGAPAGVIRVKAEPDGSYKFLYDNGYEEDLD